jgi:hypothetical protein
MGSRSFTIGLAVVPLVTACGGVDRAGSSDPAVLPVSSAATLPPVSSAATPPPAGSDATLPPVSSQTTDPPHRDDVFVEATEIIVLESSPVQARLMVRGSLPTPCHEAVWDVVDVGEAIDVGLWSEPDPEDDCIQVIEPFEISIALGSFEAANSPVLLNGEEIGRLRIGSEPDAGDVSLVGAGWSFGMCGGYCNADLDIDGDALVFTGSGHIGEEPLFVNRGTLTTVARERIDTAVKALVDDLEPVYGCPDCADGGAGYVVLASGDTITRHDMEFGRPPAVLVELREIAVSIIGPLETCESNELVDVADDCTPWPAR